MRLQARAHHCLRMSDAAAPVDVAAADASPSRQQELAPSAPGSEIAHPLEERGRLESSDAGLDAVSAEAGNSSVAESIAALEAINLAAELQAQMREMTQQLEREAAARVHAEESLRSLRRALAARARSTSAGPSSSSSSSSSRSLPSSQARAPGAAMKENGAGLPVTETSGSVLPSAGGAPAGEHILAMLEAERAAAVARAQEAERSARLLAEQMSDMQDSLQAAVANRTELEHLLAEHDSQLGHLRVRAEQSEEEVRQLESTLAATADDAKDRIGRVEEAVRDSHAEIERQRAELEALEQACAEWARSDAALRESLATCEDGRGAALSRAASLEERVASLSTERDALRVRAEAAESREAAVRERERQAQATASIHRKWGEDFERLVQREASLSTSLAGVTTERDELLKEVATLRESNSKLLRATRTLSRRSQSSASMGAGVTGSKSPADDSSTRHTASSSSVAVAEGLRPVSMTTTTTGHIVRDPRGGLSATDPGQARYERLGSQRGTDSGQAAVSSVPDAAAGVTTTITAAASTLGAGGDRSTALVLRELRSTARLLREARTAQAEAEARADRAEREARSAMAAARAEAHAAALERDQVREAAAVQLEDLRARLRVLSRPSAAAASPRAQSAMTSSVVSSAPLPASVGSSAPSTPLEARIWQALGGPASRETGSSTSPSTRRVGDPSTARSPLPSLAETAGDDADSKGWVDEHGHWSDPAHAALPALLDSARDEIRRLRAARDSAEHRAAAWEARCAAMESHAVSLLEGSAMVAVTESPSTTSPTKARRQTTLA